MRLPALLALSLLASPLNAQCGGHFSAFVDGLRAEAIAKGHDVGKTAAFFRTVQQDPKVLKADRAQGVFQKPFTEFARRLISQSRLDRGKANATKFDATFDRIEADYGAVQGDFNTLNALVTLAHDCRRPDLFRPQIFAALELSEHGDFDPATTTGAWAGEIGMVQMLPADILENGVDGDGDGHVRLKTSAPDALLSGGKMLSGLGWRKGEPWLQEIVLPDRFDWSLTGLQESRTAQDWAALGVRARTGALTQDLPASVLIPEGHKGPAFLAYPNFRVYFEWNQSFVYVLTAAYFATRLDGAPVFDARAPEPGLAGPDMQVLQGNLQARGHDVGKVDGILGQKTRDAVRIEQARLGLPVDGWPTVALLGRL